MISWFSPGSLNDGLASGLVVADIAALVPKFRTGLPVSRADRADTG